MPARIFSSVDFPVPLPPTRPVRSSGVMSQLAPSNNSLWPKRLAPSARCNICLLSQMAWDAGFCGFDLVWKAMVSRREFVVGSLLVATGARAQQLAHAGWRGNGITPEVWWLHASMIRCAQDVTFADAAKMLDSMS